MQTYYYFLSSNSTATKYWQLSTSSINVIENTEGAIKNGQSREDKTNQKQNTIRVGHHYTQTNTNNVIKAWALLQTTGGNYYICQRLHMTIVSSYNYLHVS